MLEQEKDALQLSETEQIKLMAEVKQQFKATLSGDLVKAIETVAVKIELGNIDELMKLKKLEDVVLSEDGRMEEQIRSSDMVGALPPGTFTGQGEMKVAWNGFGRFNRKLYEQFAKDMRNRLNPSNGYGDLEEIVGLASKVSLRTNRLAAKFVMPKGHQAPKQEDQIEDRKVPEPRFKSVSFGAAAYATSAIEIDGELGDWGELKHGLKHTWFSNGEKLTDGPTLHLRWNSEGMFLCYQVRDDSGINFHDQRMYRCDALEFFVDTSNVRKKDIWSSPSSQQLFLAPFGSKGNPELRYAEVGWGHRNMGGWKENYSDTLGQCRGKKIEGGYQVEAFISRHAFVNPIFVPGKYIAVNTSINLGNKVEMQWGMPKSAGSWCKPETWGDVLLLGSDGELRCSSLESVDEDLTGILPGQPLRVEVKDADMNVYPSKRDRISVTCRVKGTELPLLMILKETDNGSGIFEGIINTQAHYKGIVENTLNIRGGDRIEILYSDARAAYGEKNREVKVECAVGWPLTHLSL